MIRSTRIPKGTTAHTAANRNEIGSSPTHNLANGKKIRAPKLSPSSSKGSWRLLILNLRSGKKERRAWFPLSGDLWPGEEKLRALAVWMNGEHVGEWQLASGHGHEFVAYAETWASSPNARPLSLSPPLRPSREPYRRGVAGAFRKIYYRITLIPARGFARRFNARSTGAFDLLLEIGRDCVGALQLTSEGVAPPDTHQITGKRITKEDVEKILIATLDSKPGIGAPSRDAFRISIAGAQEKTALLWHGGAWMEPSGSTPTTHILKLPIGRKWEGYRPFHFDRK